MSGEGTGPAGGLSVDSEGNVTGDMGLKGGNVGVSAGDVGLGYGGVNDDGSHNTSTADGQTAAGLLGENLAGAMQSGHITYNVADAATMAQQQNTAQRQNFIDKLISGVNVVSKYTAPQYSPVTSFLDRMYAPDTEQEIRDAAVQGYMEDGGVDMSDISGTGNLDREIGMWGSQDPLTPGTMAGYGQRSGGDGSRNSPLTQLIKTNLAGLNPTEAQAPAIMAEIAQEPEGRWGEISLWEALMPKLRVGGTPLGESTNYSGGGLYG